MYIVQSELRNIILGSFLGKYVMKLLSSSNPKSQSSNLGTWVYSFLHKVGFYGVTRNSPFVVDVRVDA